METHEDCKHKGDDNISTKLWKLQQRYRANTLLLKANSSEKALFYTVYYCCVAYGRFLLVSLLRPCTHVCIEC